MRTVVRLAVVIDCPYFARCFGDTTLRRARFVGVTAARSPTKRAANAGMRAGFSCENDPPGVACSHPWNPWAGATAVRAAARLSFRSTVSDVEPVAWVA